MTKETPIYVTRPYLPPLDEFIQGLREIWDNRWLTNNGPMLERFHQELAIYLKEEPSHLAIFTNGTLALEMGFYAMGLAGAEVITTPFTFVATSHALRRIGATPVFADIDPVHYCLTPESAEQKITSRTRAIVPVHVYGHPCDVDGFAALGEKYGIKIIYDAAHAFGVRGKKTGKSIGSYGDMSMFSFHPTKLFHSCEGGLLIFKDPALQEKLFHLRNFAIQDELTCVDVGTNAKMNELSAWMGLSCLKVIDSLLASRKRIWEAYRSVFRNVPDLQFSLNTESKFSPNYAYCPILFPSNKIREKVYNSLKKENIFTRRYFYPLLTDFKPYYYAHGETPIASEIASRILCLPTYDDLQTNTVLEIANRIVQILQEDVEESEC